MVDGDANTGLPHSKAEHKVTCECTHGAAAAHSADLQVIHVLDSDVEHNGGHAGFPGVVVAEGKVQQVPPRT